VETATKPKVRLRVRGMTRVISKIQKKGLSAFMLMRHEFETDKITKGFSRPELVKQLAEQVLNAYAVSYYVGQIRLPGSQLKKDVGGTKWEVELLDVTVEYL
jgi:hypothetical protein